MLACSAKLKGVFFGKLDHRVVSYNWKFWKTVGPHKESIILNNNNKTISNNEELGEIFNKHFSKLVENLDIDKTLASNIANSDINDSVFNTVKKYESHPSVKKSNISWALKIWSSRLFLEEKKDILAEIHNLDNKKACQESDIPVKIIKDNIDIFSEFIFHNFNNSIFDATFPSELKKFRCDLSF